MDNPYLKFRNDPRNMYMLVSSMIRIRPFHMSVDFILVAIFLIHEKPESYRIKAVISIRMTYIQNVIVCPNMFKTKGKLYCLVKRAGILTAS